MRTFNLKRLFVEFALVILVGLLVNAVGPVLIVGSLAAVPNRALAGALQATFFPLLGYLIIAGGFIFILSDFLDYYRRVQTAFKDFSQIRIQLDDELKTAAERAQAEPEKAKPAWDVARVKLELYFDRNLSQINYIFWLSVVVMIIGFAFILFGISRAFNPAPTVTAEPVLNNITPTVVGTLAGIITEFIGATFLFLYRATVQQAVAYTRSLERINSVGMAMQILDTISGEEKALQDQTKAELVKLLLTQSDHLTGSAKIEQR
jgi:nitrate reductase gamma subunit